MRIRGGTRVWRGLSILLSISVLGCALMAGSPALAAKPSPTRSCGRFKVYGWPVTKVRVTKNLTCAAARRMMLRYHRTGQGLSCFTFDGDAPIYIRCKGRVAVGGSRSGTAASRRYAVALISFSLPDCAAAGDCGI